jgi:hypothetical protein
MNTGLYIFTVDLKYGGSIVGIVRDAVSNQPLNGVEVRILETGRTQVTSPTGIYRYGNASGLHHVIFSREGYISDTLAITTPAGTTDTVYVNLHQFTASAVRERNPPPTRITLHQNYPNPFNPTTLIAYEIPESGPVSLKVFSSLGQEVRTLVNAVNVGGEHFVEFDASGLSSGFYFYTLTAGSHTLSKKMVISK